MAVYVLDKKGRPLMPCTEKRARLLLERGRARVHYCVPFVIRLVDRLQSESELQSLTVKIDPGSKVTGIALVREREKKVVVLSLIELVHRGASSIKKSLGQRAGYRRRRRSANLRHRAPRFLNRTKPKGWLAPSLQHRVNTTLSWVDRLQRWTPVAELAVERVKFDMQKMENPEIQDAEYQQGTLMGFEVKEYLLARHQHTCSYCAGLSKDPILEVEHIVPRGLGGTHRIGNLTLVCKTCNGDKGMHEPGAWQTLCERSKTAINKARAKSMARILDGYRPTLKDAAAVNATRNALFQDLLATGLPVEAGTGGQTKYNRHQLRIPKTHALDAACVGVVATIEGWKRPTLTIKATGRGSYQRTRTTASGFPNGVLTRQKRHFGFQTGDRVRADVPSGKKAGLHRGRVAIRITGSFNIQGAKGVVQGINHRHCAVIQKADGYGYTQHPFDSANHKEAARAGSRAA